jgi:hypothetical protein
MPSYPNTKDDTVLYEPENIYSDKDIKLSMLDNSILEIWGNAYYNGYPLSTSPHVVLRPTATVADITAASLALSNAGGGVLELSPGVYKLNQAPGMTLHNGVHLRGSPGTILEFGNCGGSYPCLIAGTLGTLVPLTVNAAAGASTVTLPTGAGAQFAVDDVIGFISNTVVSQVNGKSRELHQVISVAGDVVTLDSQLYFAYNTVDAASYFTVTPKKDIVMSGFTMKWSSDVIASGVYTRGPIFQRAIRCHFYDITSVNGPGVSLDDAIHCSVRNLTVDGSKDYANATSYGVTVSSSGHGTIVSDCSFRATRHGVTTLGAQDAVPNYWSGPFNTTVANCMSWGGPESYAAFDTHEHAFDTLFIGCHAMGPVGAGTTLFQDRANRTTITKCYGYGAIRAVTLATGTSSFATIEGCFFRDFSSQGVACSGTNASILNNRFMNAIGAGGVYGVNLGGSGANHLVIGNEFIGVFGVAISDGQTADNGQYAARNIIRIQTGSIGIGNWRGLAEDNIIMGDGVNGLPNFGFQTTGRCSRQIGPPKVTAFVATYTPLPTWNSCIQIILTNNITIANPNTNQIWNGLTFRLILQQDATGGRTCTFGTAYKKNWTPVTTPNTFNIIDFQYDNVALAWVQIASEVGVV